MSRLLVRCQVPARGCEGPQGRGRTPAEAAPSLEASHTVSVRRWGRGEEETETEGGWPGKEEERQTRRRREGDERHSETEGRRASAPGRTALKRELGPDLRLEPRPHRPPSVP